MFEDFWILYPRKVAKAHAKKIWARLSACQQGKAIDALPNHIRYWEIAGTDKTFIPHPGTWLHGERFDDEIELPAPKTIVPNWWSSEQGILKKAQEIGITPGLGEGWFELKNRINEKLRKSG